MKVIKQLKKLNKLMAELVKLAVLTATLLSALMIIFNQLVTLLQF